MKRFATVMAVLFALGCGTASEPEVDTQAEAATLYQNAVAAEQDGRLGESERALEEILADYASETVAVTAGEMLGRIREDSQAAALAALRQIHEAQANFMATRRRYAISMEELVEQFMLPEDPSRPDLGYDIIMRGSPSGDRYSITADPTSGVGEKRAYFSDGSEVIRWAIGEAATADSPALTADSPALEEAPESN